MKIVGGYKGNKTSWYLGGEERFGYQGLKNHDKVFLTFIHTQSIYEWIVHSGT